MSTPRRSARPLEAVLPAAQPRGRAQAQGARPLRRIAAPARGRVLGAQVRVAQGARGEALGLVGRNGSGKSTFLKLIAGIHRPTSGDLLVARGTRIGSMIELGTGFHPELTGQENVLLNTSIHGLSRAEALEVYDDVVAYSGLRHFMDVPLKNYSSGMTMRLGFAIAATTRSRRPAARRDFRRRRRGLSEPVHGDAPVVPGARQDDPVRVALGGRGPGGLPPRGAPRSRAAAVRRRRGRRPDRIPAPDGVGAARGARAGTWRRRGGGPVAPRAQQRRQPRPGLAPARHRRTVDARKAPGSSTSCGARVCGPITTCSTSGAAACRPRAGCCRSWSRATTGGSRRTSSSSSPASQIELPRAGVRAELRPLHRQRRFRPLRRRRTASTWRSPARSSAGCR